MQLSILMGWDFSNGSLKLLFVLIGDLYTPSFVAINSYTRGGQKVGREPKKDSIIT